MLRRQAVRKFGWPTASTLERILADVEGLARLGDAINDCAPARPRVNWLIGVVVVEVLFNYPGLGRLLLDAAMRNDITLLMGGTLVLTLVAVASQVLADIGLYFMNPRIRFQRSADVDTA